MQRSFTQACEIINREVFDYRLHLHSQKRIISQWEMKMKSAIKDEKARSALATPASIKGKAFTFKVMDSTSL